MLKLIDIHAIIKLKKRGDSNRKVSKELGYDRKTIPKYDSSNRQRRKCNEQMDKLMIVVLKQWLITSHIIAIFLFYP